MKNNFLRTIIILVLIQSKVFAQGEVFHDIMITKSFYSKDKSTIYSVSPAWKHIYDEVGWRRWSVNGQVKKQLNAWSLAGGMGMYYTFDKDIQNNLELRPYLLLGLKTPVLDDKIIFSQSLRSELRTFLYGDSKINFTTTRLRYNINTVFILKENAATETKWKLRPETEWYMLKNKDIRERFVSSAEYALMLLREKGEREVGIGYRLEKFNRNFYTSNPNGHTIALEINF